MDLAVFPCRAFDARGGVPGDKAVSHRAAILLALSHRGGMIRGFSSARDCRATLGALRALGARIAQEGPSLVFSGGGWPALRAPLEALDCGNSGSTMRMLAGVAAGCPFEVRLTGDDSLRRRPMARVAEPLRAMGAEVACEGEGGRPPLRVRGRSLKGMTHVLSVASAQVKTAILLAGLRAEGRSTVREPSPSRDHTERMLIHLGVPVLVEERCVTVEGGASWEGGDLEIPGDPSSAAFFIAAAACRPGFRARFERVGLNRSRLGFVTVLKRMGAKMAARETGAMGGEPVGILEVEGGGGLRGTRITADEVPGLIDELPVLALAATQAEGETLVEGAGELRVKESDRIEALAAGLRAMGARIETRPDGFLVVGPTPLRGAMVDSFGDHRIAMTLAIAGKLATGKTLVRGADCIGVSFPEFPAMLAAASR